MTQSSRGTGTPDALEVLVAFEGQFGSEGSTTVGEWVRAWPDHESRVATACMLLESAAERMGYDFGWLLEQTHDSRIPETVWRSGCLLRAIFADQVAKRLHPRWSEYSAFGATADELLLRDGQDRCYLGQVISGRYHLECRLGGGGLGVVYEAIDAESGEPVAIKVPLSGEFPQPYDAALRKEAAFIEAFDILGTPKYLELLETAYGPMLVTELVRGRTLDKIGRVGSERALRLVAQVAETLDELHRRGHIHGDVKPDNILVDEAGATSLIDFNLSRADDPLDAADGFPGGTLPFMSPESILGVGADVDLRQDIYALGSLLYQLVTGEPLTSPEGREEAVVMSVLIGGAYEPSFPDDVPESVRRTCRAAVARQPLNRFETAGDFAETCRAAARGCDDDLPIPPPRPELHAWRLGVALGTLAVRQRRITTELGDDPDAGAAALKQLAPYVAGFTASMDEALPLAERLGLAITAWDGAEAYQALFYRANKPRPTDVDDLLGLAVEAEHWVRDALETTQEQLTTRAPGCAALYYAAVQSRFAPYSSKAATQWPEVAAPGGMPDSVVERFATACASNNGPVDLGEELKRLDYAVVRWLRWGTRE